MDASSLVRILICSSLAGCGPVVQAGLANGPGLGGATPEMRVHDAIANGHDACERAGFPQGEVLRGHIPPCGSEKGVAKTAGFLARTPATRSEVPPSYVRHTYSFSACPNDARLGNRGIDRDMTTFPRSAPDLWLACDAVW
jgi:hypothetical protein